jgi:hypothetical protein
VWVRRAVFDYKELFKKKHSIKAGSNCTAIHVRRGDVILDTRHYFPLAFYVEMIPDQILNDPNHYIFLLTDDSGVLEEAHEFYPHLKWTYFDRYRHKGSEATWEDHTPSGDPAVEMINILAGFDLAQECATFVQGDSGFSKVIQR